MIIFDLYSCMHGRGDVLAIFLHLHDEAMVSLDY